ncbi:TPA: type 1 fimbrial protein [Salmonella enterica]|nr:type 1 fimbrial protein [Salmonella enterica]
MRKNLVLLMTVLWSGMLHAISPIPYLPPGVTLPEYWGEEKVWWDGRVSFSGEVLSPTCTLAMESTYQAIDMGSTPVRELQDSFVGPQKKFRLQLRNCELAGTGKTVYTASRVRVTFDGVQGEAPDKFSLTGQAEGINLQILDRQGYPARVGEVMPPLLLNGNEDGLDYTLRVVRNGQPLKTGGYYAALRFKVDYE